MEREPSKVSVQKHLFYQINIGQIYLQIITKNNSISIRGFKLPTLNPTYLIYDIFYDHANLPYGILNQFQSAQYFIQKICQLKDHLRLIDDHLIIIIDRKKIQLPLKIKVANQCEIIKSNKSFDEKSSSNQMSQVANVNVNVDVDVNVNVDMQNDFSIQIQVYVGNSKQEQLEISKKTEIYNNEGDYIRIIVPFSKAKTMTVKSLLLEHNIPNFQSISLLSQNQDFYLKSIDFFSKIQESKIKIGDIIKFIGIQENILFYKQIRLFSNAANFKTMEQIYEDLTLVHKVIDKKQVQQIKQKVKQRATQLIEQSYKEEDFLGPIVLFTLPGPVSIFKIVNIYFHQAQISNLETQLMLKQHWQLHLLSKLVKSFDKIPNYIGYVHKGVKNVAFHYKKNDIIQFKTITITSKEKDDALYFIKGGQFMTVFNIQTFSGKEISKFSYFKIESQVLISPYTKFKVQRSLLNPISNILQIDLLQLPVPKNIPGDIVIWVDYYTKQDQSVFGKIVKVHAIKDLQLIHLKSNEHLQDWIKEFKPIFSLNDVRIHFIANLYRPYVNYPEEVDILRIVRNIRENIQVAFYVKNVKQTQRKLQISGFANDAYVKVVDHQQELQEIICSWSQKK